MKFPLPGCQPGVISPPKSVKLWAPIYNWIRDPPCSISSTKRVDPHGESCRFRVGLKDLGQTHSACNWRAAIEALQRFHLAGEEDEDNIEGIKQQNPGLPPPLK